MRYLETAAVIWLAALTFLVWGAATVGSVAAIIGLWKMRS